MATIRDYLDRAVETVPDRTALRFKRDGEWRSWTYRELDSRARGVATIAWKASARPGRSAVALIAENGPEWVAAYLGLAGIGITVTPVDPKLRESEMAHILRDAGVQVAFVGSAQASILVETASVVPDLKTVIVLPPSRFDPSTQDRLRWVSLSDDDLTEGDKGVFARNRPRQTDLASLIYTSGTTGLPKGAMLTHANFHADVEGALKVLEVQDEDDFLVVLPLHHAFGFIGNLMIPLATRSRATYVESLKTVGDNLRECSPTVLLAVPLLVEKLYRRMQAGLRKSLPGTVLNRLGILGPLRRKTAAALGGRLRLLISGGAPCPVELIDGLRRFGVPVLEGYGLTETSPVVTLSGLESYRPGSVGRALPGIDLSIREPTPEGMGEIAVRGPIVMRGYYHRPEATAEVFDGEWFLTGDIGAIDADGYVWITGRKKNVIVNREGKNIYPEEVEAVVNRQPWVLESLVLGTTERGETGERVGIIVAPDMDALSTDSAAARATRDPEALNRLMRKVVQTACRELAEYKRPRRIQVRVEPFDKTPTQKIKRYLYHLQGDEV